MDADGGSIFNAIDMCSGNFKKFDFDVPVIYPNKIIASIVKSIRCTKKLDILIPNSNQYSSVQKGWSEKGYQANILSANPLNLEAIKSVSSMFRKSDSELLILDCMSYSQKHVKIIKEVYTKPIICPQSILPSLIGSIYT